MVEVWCVICISSKRTLLLSITHFFYELKSESIQKLIHHLLSDFSRSQTDLNIKKNPKKQLYTKAKKQTFTRKYPKFMLDGANWSLFIMQSNYSLSVIAKNMAKSFDRANEKNYIIISFTKVKSLQYNTLNV